ncbi:MAG: hypothetical protein FWH19_03760 [Treponema sp.]|nr:hypothetical protein [Treponema sp.]
MNRKCIFLLLAILAVFCGTIYAQEGHDDPFKNTIMLKASLIGTGLSYERNLTPQISIGAEACLDFLFLTFSLNYNLSFFGRYYIWENQPLYTELGLGLGVVGGFLFNNAAAGFHIKPGVGWKIPLGRSGEFVIQPSIHMPFAIGRNDTWDDNRFNVGSALIANVGFGYAY